MTTRTLGLGMVAALCACAVDFTEPERDQPTRLDLNLSHLDLDASELVVTAALRPGTDSRGQALAVVDDVLRVGDRLLVPAAVDWRGARSYSASWIVDWPPDIDVISVDPPAVGPSLAVAPIDVGLARRMGSHVLHVAPGDSIILSLAGGGPSQPGSASSSWAVEVAGVSPQFRFEMWETGAVPPRIALSTHGFPDGWGQLAVRVRAYHTWDAANLAGDYLVRMSVGAHLHWAVHPDTVLAQQGATHQNRGTPGMEDMDL